jgi:hypothetical protein
VLFCPEFTGLLFLKHVPTPYGLVFVRGEKKKSTI